MPAAFPGIRGQTQTDDYVDFSGTITTGGTAQLVVPQQLRRLSLYFQNLSASAMYLGVGPQRPLATIAGGSVSAIANPPAAGGAGGVGFTVVPQVVISGGIYPGDYQTAPSHPAVAHVNGLSGTGGITGFTIDDPGVGYVVAPLVSLVNPAPQLGGGAFLPAVGAGILVASGGGFFSLGGALLVPAGAVWVFDATGGDAFNCKVGIA